MTERIERWSTVPRQMGGKIRKEVSSEDRIVVNCMFLMKLVNGRGIPGNGPVLLDFDPVPRCPSFPQSLSRDQRKRAA